MSDRSPDFRCREATLTDISAILALHNANARPSATAGQTLSHPSQSDAPLQSLSQGFLLAKMTAADVQTQLEQSHRYFLAFVQEREDHPVRQSPASPVGFVAVAKPTLTSQMLQSMTWEASFDPTCLIGDRHLYIQTVAVDPDWRGQGVGRFLYRWIYQRFPECCVSLFVATKPLCNKRSFTFHQKQGFQAVGTFRTAKLLDLENYESVLFFRKPATSLKKAP